MKPNRITRREVLKSAIAAGGAVAAASFLPDKWLKPTVVSGVLPAHAQGSIPSLGAITGTAYYDLGGGDRKPVSDETVALFSGFVVLSALSGGGVKLAKLADGPTPIDTTQTDSNGAYAFNDLAPGQYTVLLEFESHPSVQVDLSAGETEIADLVVSK